MDTMLRYYLHIDPRQLSDVEWCEMIAQLTEIRKREGTIFK